MKEVFPATIRLRGAHPYIAVDASRATSLLPGWRRPLPVIARINGLPRNGFSTHLMPLGDGSFIWYLHGNARRASGTAVGDRVHVELEWDPRYRQGAQLSMPAELLKALAHHPLALRNWSALPLSRQKEVLRYLARLTSNAARTRNVTGAIRVLSGIRGRFLGREWVGGR